MSGGSLDCVCYKVDEAADTLSYKGRSPEVRAFAKHLRLVAKALHDCEWVISGDYGTGGELESIRAVISDSAAIAVCVEDAREALDALNAALASAAGVEAKPCK